MPTFRCSSCGAEHEGPPLSYGALAPVGWETLPDSYERVSDRWPAPDRADDPPTFGWLRTEVPVYPQCTVLKTLVHSRAPGVRPFIEIEHTDHQLSVEQRTGITMQRVEEIAASLMHGSG